MRVQHKVQVAQNSHDSKITPTMAPRGVAVGGGTLDDFQLWAFRKYATSVLSQKKLY